MLGIETETRFFYVDSNQHPNYIDLCWTKIKLELINICILQLYTLAGMHVDILMPISVCLLVFMCLCHLQKTSDLSRLYDMGTEYDRRPFIDKMLAFLEEKGTPITAMPSISKQPLDLYRLYHCVREKGGMVEVSAAFRGHVRGCMYTWS